MIKVELISEPFAVEVYHYDTLGEAVQAVERLVRHSAENFAIDRVERRVAIVIDQAELLE